MSRAPLERGRELSELNRLVAALADGQGGLALIEGPAGIGKTTLLRALTASAGETGIGVLSARGSELERSFAFGAVRQLVEPKLTQLAAPERERVLSGAARIAEPVVAGGGAPHANPRGAPAEAMPHGLYGLVANLAEREPLVLAVDDAHWADQPSVEFLGYLARRLEGVPVLVVLAARSDEPGAEPDVLRAIATQGTVLRPAPLSPRGVASLARDALGPKVGDDICDACHPASGGNPFLLGELLADLRERIERGHDLRAGDVPAVEPRGVAALVAGRLAAIGGAAPALATALAVLGDGTDLRRLAELAQMPIEGAGRTADELTDAMIFSAARPPAFMHPLLRSAVYGQLGPSERRHLHARAARLLAASGGSSEAVATHLLETEGSADPWVVDILRAAAAGGLARGSPRVAVTYLKRALGEPPAAGARAEVLTELGVAEDLAGDPAGIEHLQAALEATPPGVGFARAARALAQGLIPLGRLEDAVDVLDTAITQLPDAERELALEIEAEAATAGRLGRSTFARTVERLGKFDGGLAGETPGERLVLANLAVQQLAGGTARAAAAIARQALDAGLLAEVPSASATVYDALFAALIADAFELAHRCCDGGLADARGRGALREVGVNLMFRSQLAYREGRIADAEADASAALGVLLDARHVIAMTAAAFLIDALIERGEHDAAADALARVGGEGEIPDTWMTNWLLYSRGQLRIARGDADGGLADLELLGEREHGYLGSNPGVYPYRSRMAIVLAGRGEHDRAGDLAAEELELARAWGSPRSTGMAQRALGLVEDDGLEHLYAAVATLEPSGDRLEHARALVDLGAALRRAGKRTEAREQLGAGMDLAQRCGAVALASRAREELVVAGARPRRTAQTGVDSLTASERRITQMAAEGLTNKEIAQALFVTVRTVEMHLGNAYRKLEISSRKELPLELFGKG